MKKILCIISIVTLMCLSLLSCQGQIQDDPSAVSTEETTIREQNNDDSSSVSAEEATTQEQNSDDTSSVSTEEATTREQNNDDPSAVSTDDITIQGRDGSDTSVTSITKAPGTITLRFESYEGLYDSLHDDKCCDDYPSEYYGNCFSTFLDSVNDHKTALYCPAYHGEKVQLKPQNGNTVLLRSQEKFNMPWTVYYCNIDGNDIVFEISYLSSIENSNISDTATYSDISTVLSPAYPVAKTFSDDDKTVYNSITEKKLTLDSDRETVATIFDYNEDTYWHRVNYRFRYDDILVSVWNSDSDSYDFINEDLIRSLSFIELKAAAEN